MNYDPTFIAQLCLLNTNVQKMYLSPPIIYNVIKSNILTRFTGYIHGAS